MEFQFRSSDSLHRIQEAIQYRSAQIIQTTFQSRKHRFFTPYSSRHTQKKTQYEFSSFRSLHIFHFDENFIPDLPQTNLKRVSQ